MKNKLRRALALGLTVALLPVMTGCGNTNNVANEKESSVVESSKVESSKAENEEQEVVTINWYMQAPIENLEHQASVEEAANKLIAEKLPNIQVHFNMMDAVSFEKKALLLGASQEGVDIVLMTGDWINKLDDNVRNGSVMPLNDLLDKYGQDILAKVDPRALEAVTYGGDIMAVPGQGAYASPVGMVFKKDLVEKYNFDYQNCKTLEDLEPYLATIKENEPDIIPLLAVGSALPISVASNSRLEEVVKGIYFDNETEKLVIQYSEENTGRLAYTKTMHEFYKKGYISKDAAVMSGYNSEAQSGKYAVMRQAGTATADGSKSTALYGFECVESVTGTNIIRTGTLLSALAGISVNSQHPEEAMQLLNLIWSDPMVLNTLAYGVEGQDYVVVEGAGTEYPTIKANEGAEQKWAIWHNWLGPLFDQWPSNWNSKEALEEMQRNNETGEASKIAGFLFDSDPVATEVAACSAVINEAAPIMNTGSMEDYDEYLAEIRDRLDKAGIEVVKAEVQRQLDEWRARKQ